MKKSVFIYVSIPTLFILLTAFLTPEKSSTYIAENGDDFAIPEDVTAIMDKSCFGCHNTEAKSDKAKKNLLIDKMGTLSPVKLVGKLGEISDVVKENEMPPEKFLAKYPDKKLTEDERKRLFEWADTTADALLK